MGPFSDVPRGVRVSLLWMMSAGACAGMAAGQAAGPGKFSDKKQSAGKSAEESAGKLARGDDARKESAGKTGARAAGDPAGQSWVAVGPAQIVTATYGAVSGRVTSVAVDASDATGNTVVVGTGGGGVWRSVNAAAAAGAVKFIPLTDDLAAFNGGGSGEISTASLSVGAVTIQPGGTGVVLAGTGEASLLSDAYYGEGLLRSVDNGQSWALVPGSKDGVAGNHEFTGEGFAGFAWSGATAGTVVAAVGTAGNSSAVNAVIWGASVRGLYVSLDAGATWGIATVEDVEGDGTLQFVQWSESEYVVGYDGNSALAVVWNAARKRFYAAVEYHGVYSSADGVTWMRLENQPGPGLELVQGVCPTDPGFGGSPTCPMAQAVLAVEPVSGDMYAWYVDADGGDRGMWRDVCGTQGGNCANAVTFGTQINTVALDDGSGKIAGGLEYLALAAVAGKGGTALLAGGEGVGSSGLAACQVAGGCTWQTTCGSGAGTSVVPGTLALVAAGVSEGVLVAGEGGLWREDFFTGSCGAGDFKNLNGGIGSIALTNSVAGSAANAGQRMAGAGALGTAGVATAKAAWPQVEAGDGGGVKVDSSGGVEYAASGPGAEIARCTLGAGCGAGDFAAAIGAGQVEGDAALEHAPYLLDVGTSGVGGGGTGGGAAGKSKPRGGSGADGESQVIVGTCRVWRGPATGAGWTAGNLLSPFLDGDPRAECGGNTMVQSLAAGGPVTASGSQVIYAGMTGLSYPATANAGHVFVTVSADTGSGSVPWTDIALSPVTNDFANQDVFNVGEFNVTSVTADGHDPTGGTVYVTIAGISGNGFSVPPLYRSADFGGHWLNVSSNLPGEPANAVVVDPNDANTVYVGTDTGVYFTQEIGQCAEEDCWQVYGAGLPNSPAMALEADGGGVGLLRVATHGRGVWEIPLATGTVAAATTGKLAPGALTFGSQAVTTASAAENITVTNTGTNALLVTSVAMTGDFSETDDCAGASVAPGKSCVAAVIFSPTAVGTRTGTLTAYGNVAGGQMGPATLTGTGTKAPQVVISPSGTLNFGDGTVGQTSAAEDVEVANVGETAVTLDSYAVTGDFAISANTCGATLGAQTGCTLGLTFSPTASGARTGVLTVTDTAGAQTLALEGTGQTAASVALTPGTLTFGATNIGARSGAETATATNSGDESAQIVQVTASGDFQAVSSCGASVAGHSACTIAVTFVPTQAGARTGTLTVVTPFETLTSGLTGTGVGTAALVLNPGSLAFGTEDLQQRSAPETITVTNAGTAAVTVTGVTTTDVTPGTNDYAATSNCGVLAAGANCTVSVTFTPSVAGPDAGTLTVAASGLGNGVTAALTGAGNTLGWASGQAPVAAVPAGQTASYALWLEDVGFQGTVSVSCTGLPAGARCTGTEGLVLTPQSGMVSVWVTVATGPDVTGSNATGSNATGNVVGRGRAGSVRVVRGNGNGVLRSVQSVTEVEQFNGSGRDALAWGWVLLLVPLGWRQRWAGGGGWRGRTVQGGEIRGGGLRSAGLRRHWGNARSGERQVRGILRRKWPLVLIWLWILMGLAVEVAIGGITGCGSSGRPVATVARGTYTFTVVATGTAGSQTEDGTGKGSGMRTGMQAGMKTGTQTGMTATLVVE
jgi:hypothetical protein